MLKEEVNLKIAGSIAYKVLKGQEEILSSSIKNAIQATARIIIAYALERKDWVNQITVYKSGNPLATATVTPSDIGFGVVNYEAIFDEASFNDTIDEVRLISYFGTQFSIVTGLSIFKDNTLGLLIDWQITINNI